MTVLKLYTVLQQTLLRCNLRLALQRTVKYVFHFVLWYRLMTSRSTLKFQVVAHVLYLQFISTYGSWTSVCMYIKLPAVISRVATWCSYIFVCVMFHCNKTGFGLHHHNRSLNHVNGHIYFYLFTDTFACAQTIKRS